MIYEVYMDYKRVLSVQDISCFGQCSLTVALPIISACGVETCVLPSALLSTHTMGFDGFTCLDLTEEMKKIIGHWENCGIKFDAVYTGYIVSAGQAEVISRVFGSCLKNGGLKIVDPVMGDFGKLYPAFDSDFVQTMKTLCAQADIIIPNITEASLLTDIEYREKYGEEYIENLLSALVALGPKKVVLTGVGYTEGTTGVAVYGGGEAFYYPHPRVARSCHGTGDVFASAFTGSLMRGKSAEQAAVIAADFTVRCILGTVEDRGHWYGVKFESCLADLDDRLK